MDSVWIMTFFNMSVIVVREKMTATGVCKEECGGDYLHCKQYNTWMKALCLEKMISTLIVIWEILKVSTYATKTSFWKNIECVIYIFFSLFCYYLTKGPCMALHFCKAALEWINMYSTEFGREICVSIRHMFKSAERTQLLCQRRSIVFFERWCFHAVW